MTTRADVCELVGTGLLLFVIVGSGISVESLGSDPASGLFFHAIAVGLGLAVLTALMAHTSGAQFNPAVSIALWRRRLQTGSTTIRYLAAQTIGAFLGLTLALFTFSDEPARSTDQTVSWGVVVAELVGTMVLVLLILAALDRGRSSWIPAMVGGWVAVMIFSSSSTGLLNPAVTIARVFTDSYTGLAPNRALAFVVAQLVGGLTAVLLSTRLLTPLATTGT
jgi:glycerol uptake facilitator-like aquaporin